MKTAEVPYAADAEVSLTYDELQVGIHQLLFLCARSPGMAQPHIGTAHAVRKGIGTVPRHYSDKIQLCMGTGEESNP
jgi:hypothetical protein